VHIQIEGDGGSGNEIESTWLSNTIHPCSFQFLPVNLVWVSSFDFRKEERDECTGDAAPKEDCSLESSQYLNR